MVTLPSPLSTGLTFTNRQLEARGGRSCAEESCGSESTQGGSVWGGGVPSPLGNGSGEGAQPLPENFWTFEWKMARFGAFWVLFMHTAVI